MNGDVVFWRLISFCASGADWPSLCSWWLVVCLWAALAPVPTVMVPVCAGPGVSSRLGLCETRRAEEAETTGQWAVWGPGTSGWVEQYHLRRPENRHLSQPIVHRPSRDLMLGQRDPAEGSWG